MRRGNLPGLPVSLAFFTFLSLFITAGACVVLQDGRGEPLTNPADIIGQIGDPVLTVVAAVTFLVATIGIDLVADFVPPAYDIANLAPARIGFRTAGAITAAIGFVVGALWVPALAVLSGFAWVVGAVVGGALHLLVMRGQPLVTSDAAL